jgi:hypothetical protein
MRAVRYNDLIAVRAQPEVIALVHEAAKQLGIKPSQWIRSAIAMGLAVQGYDTSKIPDKPAEGA